MDSTMANYDPGATVNSGTWCIPVSVGCMMPTESNANEAWEAPAGIDGLNGNFSIFATVHDPDMCVVARYGCVTPQQQPSEEISKPASCGNKHFLELHDDDEDTRVLCIPGGQR